MAAGDGDERKEWCEVVAQDKTSKTGRWTELIGRVGESV